MASIIRMTRRSICLLAALFAISAVHASAEPLTMLHTSGINIVDANGKKVRLRGVDVGGWLMMESWMTPADKSGLTDNYAMIKTLDSRFGVVTEQKLLRTYQQNWITLQDFDNLKAQGFNFIRLPVWWLNFETMDGQWRPDAFEMVDWAVKEAASHGIYVLIDMHGVVGGESAVQSAGQHDNAYWASQTDQDATAAIWTKLAAHFRGNPAVMGYDLINEPFGAPSAPDVWRAYARLYKTVRAVDPEHIAVMDSTFGSYSWETLPDPSTYGWKNVVYEMHEYKFGGSGDAVETGAKDRVASVNAHRAWDIPAYVGEFNNFGGGSTGRDTWWRVLSYYNDDDINWTAWTYKANHGTGDDSWGLYNPKTPAPPVPDLQHDDAATIEADWKQWTTSNAYALNPMLAGVLRGGESPVSGTPQPIPGTISMAEYDNGGPGLAYDMGGATKNQGGVYRVDAVGIESTTDKSGTGDGYDIGWSEPGNWLRYTVDVAKAGTYTVDFRVSSGGTGGTFHLANADSAGLTGPITVPSTGGWQSWADVKSTVHLSAGVQTIELHEDSDGYNIEYATFTSAAE